MEHPLFRKTDASRSVTVLRKHRCTAFKQSRAKREIAGHISPTSPLVGLGVGAFVGTGVGAAIHFFPAPKKARFSREYLGLQRTH